MAPAEVVWQEFGQMFGARWADQFGSKPSQKWIDGLAPLRTDVIRGTINKIGHKPPPYPGWLPSLLDFLAVASGIQVKAAPPAEHKRTWMDSVNLLFFTWTYREMASKNRRLVGSKTKPRVIPDVELNERLIVCRRLAEDFELMEREGDPHANLDWFRESFNAQMKLIPVSNPAGVSI